jgi:Tol biopolymer transport system component
MGLEIEALGRHRRARISWPAVPARSLRRALGPLAAAVGLLLTSAAAAAPRIAIDRTTGFERGGTIETNVFTLEPNGRGLFQVTHERSPHVAELPDWSPDHGRIVFASDRGGATHLWTIGANGKHLQHLTKSDHVDSDPAWSPKGKRIAFARARKAGASGGSAFDVFTVKPDGSGLRRLAKGGFDARSPSWAPDGKQLVFSRTKAGGHPQAWTIRADGTHRHQITHVDNGVEDPAWSPNGKLIAFSSPKGFGIELFVVPARGGPVKQVTTDANGTVNAEPTWSPDSKRIVFRSSHSPPSGARIDSITPSGKGRRTVIGDPSGLTVYAAPSWG